jgi:ketosteroid isomerase-like protein
MFAFASDAQMTAAHLGRIDHVWLGTFAWTGHHDETGAGFETPMRIACEIRDDKIALVEAFDVGAERGALRAMTRLLAPRADESAPVATDLVLGLAAAINDRGWEPVEARFAPDLATVDHRRIRTLGLDRPGGEGFVDRVRGLLAVADDARPSVEPLAELDGIAMALIAWSGHLNEGGGPFEVCWRGVFLARDGLIARYELFDEDDEAGMLAAVARLRAEGASNLIADIYQRTCEAFNARDWAAARSLWADDVVLVDRRPATGWPVLRGRAELEEWVYHLHTISADLSHSFEFIEGDQECAIVRLTYRGYATEADGGGELEDAATHVSIARHGLACYCEAYKPDADIELLRARREELRPLARRRPGADLPLEPLESERALLRLVNALDAGAWETVRDLLDPRFMLIDHRMLRTRGEVRDRDAYIARERSLRENVIGFIRRYEVIAATEAACAGSLIAPGSMVDGGGSFEIALDAVFEWREARCVRVQLFDADDEAGMLAALRRLQADVAAPPATSEDP